MSYFNELPFIEYPSRFENQSSNDDYTLVRNLFRRAILRDDFINQATLFNYYQIIDNERPDQIADRIYKDPELDWVVLISNNIINHTSEWPLSNDSLYNYLIDKYGTEEKLQEIRHIETNEVRDSFNRLVVPKELEIQTDLYQEFRTKENKENPLFYNLDFFPVPTEQYPLEVKINLGQYLEVWERDNLQENQTYTGEEYQVSEINIRKPLNTTIYDFSYPEYTRLDYSYFPVYSRNTEIVNIYVPNSLDGWPYTWGGKSLIYYRDDVVEEIPLYSTIGSPVDITDDYRLYVISTFDAINSFEYTEGTTLINQANQKYTITNPSSNLNGEQSIIEVSRNSKGEIIRVQILDGGRYYSEGEIITINGSLLGGDDIIDDITLTVVTLRQSPQFRFFSIGSTDNTPFPNLLVSTFNETGLSYLDNNFNKVDVFNNQNAITHYEYEIKLNEKYRKILLLKPEYLGVFVGDLRNIMSYDKSSETIDKRIKRVQDIELLNS